MIYNWFDQQKQWIIWIVYAAITILLVAIGYLFYQNGYKSLLNQNYNEINSIADLKESLILTWRGERISDARAMAADDHLLEQIQTYRDNPKNSEVKQSIVSRMTVIKDLYSYSDVLITDQKGEVLLSVLGKNEVSPPVLINQLTESVARNDVVFGDFYSCKGCDGIRLDITAPFRRAVSTDPVLFILRIDPAQFIYPMIQTWPTPSQSGETLLVRKEGNEAIFINELRFRYNSAFQFKFPLTDTEIPAVQAVLGRTGQFLGTDYRGVPVLADLRSIPGTNWFLVSKIDQSEIFANLKSQSILGIVILSLLFVLSGITLRLLNSRAQRNHLKERLVAEQEKNKAQEVFRTTLYSIGDAVITTDKVGLVQQMNYAAENLTGWKESDAINRHIHEVFQIRNEFSGNIVENPIDRVLKEGLVVGLANHTILTAKDGKEYPISDSGAPIKDINGETTGVVLVFKDMTNDYRLQKSIQESEERYRLLFQNIPDAFFDAQLIKDDSGQVIDYRYIAANKQFEDQFDVHISHGTDNISSFTTPELLKDWLPTFVQVSLSDRNTAIELYIPSIDKTMNVKVFGTRPGEFAVIFEDMTERLAGEKSLRESEASYRSRNAELENFMEFSQALRKAQTMDEMLPSLAEYSTRAINGDSCLITLLDSPGNSFHVEYVDGFLKTNQGFAFSIQQGVSGRVLRTRQPVIVNKYLDDPDRVEGISNEDLIGPAIFVPIQSTTELLGVLCIAREAAEGVLPFTDHDIQVLSTFGENAGNAIHRANLLEDVTRQVEHLQALHNIDLGNFWKY